MKETKKYYPNAENLGQGCIFWQGVCTFPKLELKGRMSCDGIVDDVCLWIQRKGPQPKHLSKETIIWLKTGPPQLEGPKHNIPPGETKNE